RPKSVNETLTAARYSLRHDHQLQEPRPPCRPRGSMLRTMVSQLVKHERIETTVAKAKQVRRIADNMVQLGKDTLHAACVLLLLFVVMMFFINCSQSLLIAT
ncbi:unnamed protein product, partial [Musa acuminata subsp. burmannicoides]